MKRWPCRKCGRIRTVNAGERGLHAGKQGATIPCTNCYAWLGAGKDTGVQQAKKLLEAFGACAGATMTAAEVKKRVDALHALERESRQFHRLSRKVLVLDVLDAIAKSSITRSTTRALAEELRRLFE